MKFNSQKASISALVLCAGVSANVRQRRSNPPGRTCVLGAVANAESCNAMDAAFFATNGIAANTQAACESVGCCWHVDQPGNGVCHEAGYTTPVPTPQQCVAGAVSKQPCNAMDAAFFAANGIAARTQAACENVSCCWHVDQPGNGVCHEAGSTTAAPTPQPEQTPNNSNCADGSQNCHVQTPQTAQTPQAHNGQNGGNGNNGAQTPNPNCDGSQNCHVQTPQTPQG